MKTGGMKQASYEAAIERQRLIQDFLGHFGGREGLARFPFMGLLALAVPRFGVLYFHRRNRILKLSGLRRAGYLFYLLNHYLNGADIDPTADIEAGVRFRHLGAIVIGGTTRIGKGTEIFSGVTIGIDSAFGRKSGYPEIGKNCYLGTGAKIIGDLKVGDGAVVGAGAVVVRDVPGDRVAAGVPAKILGTEKPKK